MSSSSSDNDDDESINPDDLGDWRAFRMNLANTDVSATSTSSSWGVGQSSSLTRCRHPRRATSRSSISLRAASSPISSRSMSRRSNVPLPEAGGFHRETCSLPAVALACCQYFHRPVSCFSSSTRWRRSRHLSNTVAIGRGKLTVASRSPVAPSSALITANLSNVGAVGVRVSGSVC